MVEIDNLIFIGMPYSGKTTIGEFISKKIGLKFLDTDRIIEERCAKSIADIISSKGEAYFRQLEKNIIEELSIKSRNKFLMSTGGGMPIYYNNLFNLKNLGSVIFLDTNIDTIIKRANIKNNRPLIKNNTEFSLLDLYYFRFNIYKQAHIHVCLDEEPIAEQAQKILGLL